MKKIVIFLLIVLFIIAGAFVGFTNFNKNEDTSNLNTSKEETNEEKFKKLIQYKTESVKDEENLYQLLKNMEHGEYLVDIKKRI